MNNLTLPAAFEAQMQHQLGPDYDAFRAALATPPPVSIRINPRKPAVDVAGLTPVPWCAEGYYLPNRPVFTLDPLFQAGAYYVQEASSMLLAEAVRQTIGRTKTYAGQPPLKALDLCAAPGGKSTLLASALPPRSVLVCNEVIRSRVPVLRENMDKWGYANVVVSHHDPGDFTPLAGFFDLVMIDAPCSGEGLFRKYPKAADEWSPAHVTLCAARQGRILAAAAPLVAEEGWLIYSTCTYNDAENGQAMQWLADHGFQNYPLDLPTDRGHAWGVAECVFGKQVGYQCYPHRVMGEGFFISVFRKAGSAPTPTAKTRGFTSARLVHPKQVGALKPFLRDPDQFSFWQKPNDEILAVPIALEKELVIIDGALRSKGFGIDMGLFKGPDFLPSHALALSTELVGTPMVGSPVAPGLPGVDLSRDEALRYFKKENLVLPDAPRGWLLARYAGLPLGWMKGLGNRINNYLPKDWRIRMEIPEYS